MPSAHKIELVKTYKELLKDAKAFYVVDFSGINVPEMTELRRSIREKNGILKVGKNRLFKVALKELNIDGLEEVFEYPCALLIAYDDPIEPLKVFYEFMKEKGKGELKGGYVEGRALSKEETIELSKLPPKEILVGKLLSSLNSSVFGLVFVLNTLLRNLVYVLSEIKNKKGS
jgi:large subunit ribosomal protein L10